MGNFTAEELQKMKDGVFSFSLHYEDTVMECGPLSPHEFRKLLDKEVVRYRQGIPEVDEDIHTYEELHGMVAWSLNYDLQGLYVDWRDYYRDFVKVVGPEEWLEAETSLEELLK